jgi:hypothetical protein
MSLESNQSKLPAELAVEDPEGGTFYCYSNVLGMSWTAQDVKLQFYELLDDSDKFPSTYSPRLERLAVVTVSWTQLKELATVVNQAVSRYEELNGLIRPLGDVKVP